MHSIKAAFNPAIFAAALLLTGCGMAKDMSEMHDATLEMSKTTSEMNQTTAGMAKTTSLMATDMSQMLKLTQGMDDKMKTMNQKMESMGQTMTSMDGKMTSMDSKMTHMNDSMGTMNRVMGSMNQTMGTMSSDLKVMKRTTTELNHKTDGIARDAKAMRNMTGQLRDLSAKMHQDFDLAYTDGRRDSARRSRKESLEQMESAPSIQGKLISAGTYFLSMEYQLWKPVRDSKTTRDLMCEYMVMEFLGLIQNYAVNSNHVDLTDFDISSQDSKHQNLFALVTAMHLIDKTQISALKLGRSNEPAISMLTLLAEGLAAKKLVESGKVKLSQLPRYQQQVLNSEHLVVYLLQLRQLFTRGAAFTLTFMEPTGNEPTDWTLKREYFTNRFVKSSHWAARLDGRNTAQIIQAAELYEMSADTSQFLRSLGIKPLRDADVDLFLNKMTPISVPGSPTDERSNALVRLSRAYQANLPNPRMYLKGPFSWSPFN